MNIQGKIGHDPSTEAGLCTEKGPLGVARGIPHAPKVSKWMAGFLGDPSLDSLHCPGPKKSQSGGDPNTPNFLCEAGLWIPNSLDGPHRPGKTLHQQGGAPLHSPLTSCNQQTTKTTHNKIYVVGPTKRSQHLKIYWCPPPSREWEHLNNNNNNNFDDEDWAAPNGFDVLNLQREKKKKRLITLIFKKTYLTYLIGILLVHQSDVLHLHLKNKRRVVSCYQLKLTLVRWIN